MYQVMRRALSAFQLGEHRRLAAIDHLRIKKKGHEWSLPKVFESNDGTAKALSRLDREQVRKKD